MTRSALPAFLLLIAAAPSIAQQPFEPPYLERVGTEANQLFNQVEQLRIQANALRPRPEPLGQKIDAYYETVLSFSRLIPRNPSPGEVQQAYSRIERPGDEVVAEMRRLASGNRTVGPTLLQLAARIEYADRILEQAVFAGPNPGPTPPSSLLRVVRTLDAQANELVRTAQLTLQNNPLGQQLEAQVRQFNTTVDGFRQQVEQNTPVVQFQAGFAPIAAQWRAMAQTLTSYDQLWEASALRQQGGQVGELVATVGRLVGSPIDPFPPAPPNPVPNQPGLRRRNLIVTGADAGGGPHVRVYATRQASDYHDFFAYHPDFRGGVRVAVADVTGDGVPDIITAPGPGMVSLVRIYDGRDLRLIRQFQAFDAQYDRGVWVAAGDLTGDGRAEIVCGTDVGSTPLVRVFDAATAQRRAEFVPYEPNFRGGVRVAIGDVNGDGVRDIITAPGPGRPVVVRVFDGRNVANVLSQFDAYTLEFQGGGFVAAGHFRGQRADVVTGAGTNGGPHVRILDGLTGGVLGQFYAYDANFLGGVRVACRTTHANGVADVLTAPGPGMIAAVRSFDGRNWSLSFEINAYGAFTGGAFVGAR